MKDTISRYDALEVIQSMYPGMPRVPWMVKKWKKQYEPYIRVEEAIKDLPPAQPELRWIPCEEALPEEGEYVLISKKISPLSGEKWCVTVAGRFIDGRSGKVEWRDIGFGRISDDDVLAWMPRPERYIGEQE